jgi:hypothetical protein
MLGFPSLAIHKINVKMRKDNYPESNWHHSYFYFKKTKKKAFLDSFLWPKRKGLSACFIHHPQDKPLISSSMNVRKHELSQK